MKKYAITVIDNETGKVAVVGDGPIQADTDTLLILWEERGGFRKIGMNQAAWAPAPKRTGAIECLMELVENLCRSKDDDEVCAAIDTMLTAAEKVMKTYIGAEGAARVLVDMAEDMAREAVMGKGAGA